MIKIKNKVKRTFKIKLDQRWNLLTRVIYPLPDLAVENNIFLKIQLFSNKDIYCFVRIKTADGTKPQSFKVLVISDSEKVFLGNVIDNENGAEPSVRFEETKDTTVDRGAVGSNAAAMVSPFVRRNCERNERKEKGKEHHVNNVVSV